MTDSGNSYVYYNDMPRVFEAMADRPVHTDCSSPGQNQREMSIEKGYWAVEGWQERKLIVVTEELTRAKMALKAWESENLATPGVGHPLKKT